MLSRIAISAVLVAACGSSSPPAAAPAPAPAPPTAPAPRTGGYHLSDLITYRGICDASAAAGLPGGLIAIGDDEDNHLRIYDAARGGDPIEIIDTGPHLAGERGEHPEIDIEAAATIGARVYWIASHARKKSGKADPGRLKIFGTDVRGDRLAPVGRPYVHLVEDLTRVPALAGHPLDDLNIEGLAETPDGHLLVGCRNPVPDGRALVVPIENPADIVEREASARLGTPIELALEGRGVRTIARWDGAYWVVGGSPVGYTTPSRLYRWEGGAKAPAHVASIDLGDLNPEALAEVEIGGITKLLLVSDDGTRDMSGTPCKKLKDPAKKQFRAAWLEKDS